MSGVRALSLSSGGLPRHTQGMTGEARPTTFVTDAAGFIGAQLVNLLVARGHAVLGLANSAETADRVRRSGAVAIMGDLLVPGRWQDEVAADWVFHVAPHDSRADALMRVDAHLLDAVAAGATQRVVYVASAGWYGATGSQPITEDEPPRPSRDNGPFREALERLDGCYATGLPIVTALPGRVYGNGSWFRDRVIAPVLSGRRVLRVRGTGPWISTIHVHDCARALVHLAERGGAGGRYFVVNGAPVRLHDLADTFARLANRPLRVWSLPAAATRLLGRARFDDEVRGDEAFSNIRLRGLGFRFQYPAIEDGIGQVVSELVDRPGTGVTRDH